MSQIGIERLMRMFDAVEVAKEMDGRLVPRYHCRLRNFMDGRGKGKFQEAMGFSTRSWKDAMQKAYDNWRKRDGVGRYEL